MHVWLNTVPVSGSLFERGSLLALSGAKTELVVHRRFMCARNADRAIWGMPRMRQRAAVRGLKRLNHGTAAWNRPMGESGPAKRNRADRNMPVSAVPHHYLCKT